jgi:PAS domain S-box-containing protein
MARATSSSRSLRRALDVQRTTGRQQAEDWLDATSALETTLERYVLLFDKAPVGYLTLDEKGCITEINDAAMEMLGVERARAFRKPFLAFLAPRQAGRFADHLRRCARGDACTELYIRSSAGAPRPVRLDSRLVTTSEVDEPRYFTVIIDISEQRRSDEALRSSEKRHR